MGAVGVRLETDVDPRPFGARLDGALGRPDDGEGRGGLLHRHRVLERQRHRRPQRQAPLRGLAARARAKAQAARHGEGGHDRVRVQRHQERCFAVVAQHGQGVVVVPLLGPAEVHVEARSHSCGERPGGHVPEGVAGQLRGYHAQAPAGRRRVDDVHGQRRLGPGREPVEVEGCRAHLEVGVAAELLLRRWRGHFSLCRG